MKRSLNAVFLVVFAAQVFAEPSLLEERITQVENNLQPALQIKGEDSPRFNIYTRMKELGIPGISIAVANDGKIEWAKGYGMRDVAADKTVDIGTLFLAGSISKPVAAIRVHQLSEETKLDIDRNVNDYLTSWKLPDNEYTANEKVTLRRILNHTAGLTVWGFPGYDKGDRIPSIPEVLDGRGNTDAVRVYKEPGESWQYSGGGYTIMQLLVTDLEKNAYPNIMAKHVLRPLGMKLSTFENPLPEKYHEIAATGYRANGNEVEGKWPIYPEMAAAGLWTTPSDLIQYGIEIQDIYRRKTDGLLQYDTTLEMLKPGLNNHGLGPVSTELHFGHNGADEGFRASIIAWKEAPVAIVIMVNSDNGSIIQEITLSLASVYGLPGFQPDMRSIIPMTLAERQRFIGVYEIKDLGEVTLTYKDEGLESTADFLSTPGYLVPETATAFFDRASGLTVNFIVEGETVTGFTTSQFNGKKVR